MYKNVASQKLMVYAYDTVADAPKTGDAANITAQISKDGAATAASNDTNPAELDATDAPGIYVFDLTQAETNCDLFLLSAVSSTANVTIDPVVVYTTPGSNAGVTAAVASGVSTANEIADALLVRDFSNVETTAPRFSVATAMMRAINAAVSGSSLTVYRTDGATTHYIFTVTSDASADPITSVKE